MKNKYIARSRISEKKFQEIIKYFSLDLEASKVAQLSNLSRNSINKILLAIRGRIAKICQEESPVKGEIEVGESYFRGRRIKGLRGRGAPENYLFLAS